MNNSEKRWPKFVYGAGQEPDPRFTLANERTFLAWVRSALAVIAIGVAIDELEVGSNDALRALVVISLISIGCIFTLVSFIRWARIERAMRLSKPIPSLVAGLGFVVFLVVVGLLIALLTVN